MYVEIGFKCTQPLLTFVASYFKKKWPGAILSLYNGVRKPMETLTLEDIPADESLVIYKDQKALDLTDKLGWVKKTSEISIIFFHTHGELDFDFGEKEDYRWVREFQENLKVNSLYFERTPEPIVQTLDALAYGIGLKQRITENDLFSKMDKQRPVQNFPKGWQAGIVYILCGVGPNGKPYDRAPITAVSPFLDWVKAEKEYYDEIRKENPGALELKIFWKVDVSLSPIRTEGLRELGSPNET